MSEKYSHEEEMNDTKLETDRVKYRARRSRRFKGNQFTKVYSKTIYNSCPHHHHHINYCDSNR